MSQSKTQEKEGVNEEAKVKTDTKHDEAKQSTIVQDKGETSWEKMKGVPQDVIVTFQLEGGHYHKDRRNNGKP